MKYVVDSCVAFKWEVPEVDSAKAIRLRNKAHQGIHELIAPDARFYLEIRYRIRYENR